MDRDDQLVARCLEHLAIAVDLIGDVLEDLSMDATRRITIGQELQNRAGLVLGAVQSINAAMPSTASDRPFSATVTEGEKSCISEAD